MRIFFVPNCENMGRTSHLQNNYPRNRTRRESLLPSKLWACSCKGECQKNPQPSNWRSCVEAVLHSKQWLQAPANSKRFPAKDAWLPCLSPLDNISYLLCPHPLGFRSTEMLTDHCSLSCDHCVGLDLCLCLWCDIAINLVLPLRGD